MNLTQITRLLARKQKRLNYLRESFQSAEVDQEEKLEISGLLDTYAMLLSRVASLGESGASEPIAHLDKIEREINTKFENFRLRTSKLFESLSD